MRFLIEIVAEPLEVLVPVGVLDHHPHVGMGGAGRPKHQCAGHFAHFVQPVLRPAASALRRNVRIALGRVEEEIVEDDLIEVARGHLDGPLAFRAVLGILIVEGAELAAMAAGGEGDAARDGNAMRCEEFLDARE